MNSIKFQKRLSFTATIHITLQGYTCKYVSCLSIQINANIKLPSVLSLLVKGCCRCKFTWDKSHLIIEQQSNKIRRIDTLLIFFVFCSVVTIIKHNIYTPGGEVLWGCLFRGWKVFNPVRGGQAWLDNRYLQSST